jgi:primosomal protein N' (replication factor Y)
MNSLTLIKVAPFTAVHGLFTYSVPAKLARAVLRGCRVVAPFGAKRVVGMVTQTDVEADAQESSSLKIKPIDELLDERPLLPAELLDLLLWMAGYYLGPPGEVIRAALPAALHAKEKRVVRLTDEGVRVLAVQEELLRSANDDLTQKEHDLLRMLEEGGGALTKQKLRGASARALESLSRRGLVTEAAHRKSKRSFRTDLIVEVIQPLDTSKVQRAPRQAALLEAIQLAGGRVRLSQLHDRPRDARALAQRLAAKSLVRLEVVEVPRDPFASEPVEVERPLVLTAEQRMALAPLIESARERRFAAFLLHGVTGSGKTEVYLRLISSALENGRCAIVLVPEISLTPQLAARFRARFGNQVAVLHSGLTDAERYGQWRLIQTAQVKIVVGARSAIFAPLKDVGVIIVDEEHDPSFKQEEGLKYHARDVALVRAKQAGAVAVLGSATPALESYQGAERGRLELLEMPHRATPRPLPEVEIVDLRTYHTGPEGFLSAPLARALAQLLDRREQAILFLNRRGFSTFVICKACGHVFSCENCSITLTYHRAGDRRLICHYCGYSIGVPKRCPACEAEAIDLMGLGTEQVEEQVRQRFPSARVARLDRDTATGRGMRSILAAVSRREIDILVGTQMVTKGHDFPHVTLVGVICADLGLHFPDFRAAERTFQLLTQVAGRAGRGDRPGRVIIQTYSPNHPSLRCARSHDYISFYRHEVEVRRELSYPPWGYLAAVRLDGANPVEVEDGARDLGRRGRAALGSFQEGTVTLLGPTEAPIQRLKGRTRWLLLVRARKREDLRRLLRVIADEQLLNRRGRVRVSVDVDPLMLL